MLASKYAPTAIFSRTSAAKAIAAIAASAPSTTGWSQVDAGERRTNKAIATAAGTRFAAMAKRVREDAPPSGRQRLSVSSALPRIRSGAPPRTPEQAA